MAEDLSAIIIMRVILFFLFVLLTTKLFSQTTDPPPPPADSVVTGDKVFEKVDVEAIFPGANMGWRKHLEKNLDPHVPVENGAPVGYYTVIVQFIVDKTGNISDVKALTNFGYGMEEQVVRVIQKGPSWKPAIYEGKPVKAYRKQPVTFIVNADGFEVIMSDKYILYTGIENIISVKVDKVKSKDLSLSLTQGTITAGDNDIYYIKVNTPGKSILEIYNKKKNKKIGSVYFIVRKKS